MSSGSGVFTGRWTDWSRGAFVGQTVTLTTRDGAFVLAFLAFYVTVAGSQFWSILRFIAHQARVRKQALHDGLHHQQQVILRNTGSAFSAGCELSWLSFKWRKNANHAYSRSEAVVVLAFLNVIGFSLAGIFSSEVTRAAGSDVLVKSRQCGAWEIPVINATSNEAWQSKVLNESARAAAYARTCYETEADPASCRNFVSRQIGWQFDVNATCPFESGLCFFGDTAALQMDTGYIDSHDDLGLNTPKKERIRYRRVTTCAPIRAIGYAKLENTTITLSGQPIDAQFDRFYFGPNGGGLTPWTYEYNVHAILDGFGYQLTPYVANPGSANAWNPISTLNRTDADVSLFFLAQNSIEYNDPVDDPFFSAHILREVEVLGQIVLYYLGDNYVNVLACTDQHQFCNPNTSGCTSLTSYQQAADGLDVLALSDLQAASADRIVSNLIFQNMYYAVLGRGASALRASETVSELTQVALPKTQWMIEVSQWFAVGLAQLQYAMVEYAFSTPNPPAYITINSPSTLAGTLLCHEQKVWVPSGYQNFSLLGILIIIIVGSLIIILGQSIDGLVGFFRRLLNVGHEEHLAWRLDEKLQLQRMAYEGAGWEHWTEHHGSVPLYAQGQDLGQYTILESGLPTIERV